MSKFEKIPFLAHTSRDKSSRLFFTEPKCEPNQRGFLEILERIRSCTPFVYCKLNHAFWEHLVTIEDAGVAREDIPSASGASLDRLTGRAGQRHFEGGMFFDLLDWIGTRPSIEDGLIFVPSIEPFQAAREISGAPLKDTYRCRELIEHFVDPAYLSKVRDLGFSGHEVKTALLSGDFSNLMDALRDRNVITVMSDAASDFVDTIKCKSLTNIQVDRFKARYSRRSILDVLTERVNLHASDEQPPVVLVSAGDTISSWIGLQIQKVAPRIQFIDLGGALIPFFDPAEPVQWMLAYRSGLSNGLSKLLGPSHPVVQRNSTPFGARLTELVRLASEKGVPSPRVMGALPAPAPQFPIPFIENKIYDQSRIADFLSLSVAQNHHANDGPVKRLLEEVVSSITGLPHGREVVAVSSGTSALHLAVAVHGAKHPQMRWVASAFNFFSCGIGPLSHARILDCDGKGRFDLDALKALPLDSFDGVIYTNVFAQQADWDDVASYCRRNGKAFVVDNATGLFDRPQSAFRKDAPMEAISAHHTKPWGVGEGGFLICSKAEAKLVRRLANFGAPMAQEAAPGATNAKLSDLAAAAILDRLERMPQWGRYYAFQAIRAASIMTDVDRDIVTFGALEDGKSPKAHTPFLAPHPVDVRHPDVQGPVTFGKYYRPLRSLCPDNAPTPIADDLYARCFSLPNAPEMRLAPTDEIVEQVRRLIDLGGADR